MKLVFNPGYVVMRKSFPYTVPKWSDRVLKLTSGLISRLHPYLGAAIVHNAISLRI
ncbi:hypothetical protein [Sinomicrobium weinanense]|uniref:Uncharacterized protein n=1 Tax=Sinomicrobium weinanense TaxID=2842200 RepID=A0A926JSF8_9FLAO|nr:hypothetical protein [Sinomicrobium weinanense]MBC9796356.1 hypothetical protein [Sinomicrobium weinanense]MBU3122442.1 hypothetical protein [Sinomicrobium weinanense]